MRPLSTFFTLLACGFTAAVLSSTAQAAEGRAVVRAVRGTADFSMPGGDWQTLTVGRSLSPSATVRTGVSSQVDLFLGDNGPTVRLLAETSLNLKTLNFDRAGVDVVIETFLDLSTGTIQGNVKKTAEASKYEVKTPFTVCSIRGTEYQISANGRHHVLEGSLIVAYTNPQGAVSTHTVNAGQSFIPPAPTDPPTAVPTVRPTTPEDGVEPPLPPVFPPPPPPVVPEPVEFVSPGTGRPSGGG